jgi:hypothetical protein
MNDKPFDPTLPVQTRDGRKARILATDIKSVSGYSIIAVVTQDSDMEIVSTHTPTGHINSCPGNRGDLINTPQRIKGKCWLAILDSGVRLTFDSVDNMRRWLGSDKPKAIAEIPYDLEEGQGLEMLK